MAAKTDVTHDGVTERVLNLRSIGDGRELVEHLFRFLQYMGLQGIALWVEVLFHFHFHVFHLVHSLDTSHSAAAWRSASMRDKQPSYS